MIPYSKAVCMAMYVRVAESTTNKKRTLGGNLAHNLPSKWPVR
jgi:hypothetical protein